MKTPFGISPAPSSASPRSKGPDSRKKWFIFGGIALVVVIALTTLIFVTGSGASDQSRSPEPNITGSGQSSAGTGTSDAPPELMSAGQGLVSPLPEKLIPAGSVATAKKFGVVNTKMGIAYSFALAQTTAYDNDIWTKMIDGKEPQSALTPQDYEHYGYYMSETGKAKWFGLTGDPRVLAQGPGPEAFLLLPQQQAGQEWVWPYMRPSANNVADSFTLRSTSVGPDAQNGSGPTMMVDFDDYHVYDWKQDGKWVAVESHRHLIYRLSQTNNPDSPWLLDDWTITNEPGRWMEAWVRG